MLANLWVAYWLVTVTGETRVGPFGTEQKAFEHLVSEELTADYVVQKIVSYIPF